MYDATKLQDEERLSGKKRDGIAGVDHHVDFHGIETLLLQWNVQSRIKYAKLGRFVDYSKKWRLRVSDGNVFQQIAVDVYGAMFDDRFGSRSDITSSPVTYVSSDRRPERRAKSGLKSTVTLTCVWYSNVIPILPFDTKNSTNKSISPIDICCFAFISRTRSRIDA